MTFREYYADQFRLVPEVWTIAKKHRKPLAFIVTILTLLCPLVIHTMYLYDTVKMKIDKRYRKEENKC